MKQAKLYVGIVILALLAGMLLYQRQNKINSESDYRKAVRADQRLSDYLACKEGALCDRIYPDAAERVKEAKREKN
jgi:hypothetical protein